MFGFSTPSLGVVLHLQSPTGCAWFLVVVDGGIETLYRNHVFQNTTENDETGEVLDSRKSKRCSNPGSVM